MRIEYRSQLLVVVVVVVVMVVAHLILEPSDVQLQDRWLSSLEVP